MGVTQLLSTDVEEVEVPMDSDPGDELPHLGIIEYLGSKMIK
jgi:hypothetical protein